MTVQQSDLDGIARSGRLARQRGARYFDNPHFFERDKSLEEWHAIASAWAAGWVEEDAGRDRHIVRLVYGRAR